MDILKKMIDTEPDKQQFRKTFVFKNDEYGFCPNLSAITTGEYIDLEAYCKDDPIKNLHVIMSILYRKVTFKRGERYAIEEYNPEEFKEELFKDCPMDIALSSLGFFDFRIDIGDKFSQLFTSDGTETTKGVSLQSKWGWYNTLYSLANQNILNIQKITKLPILEVLTYLSYTQDYNIKQNNKY